MSGLSEALDIVVGRTGHVRYRDLCDPDHPDFNPAYIPIVMKMAGMETEGHEDATPAPQPPPLLTRALNFATAVVGHVAAGMPIADEQVISARLAICDTCDQKLPGGVCAGCGCVLSEKARWLDQKCPMDKWPKS